MKQLCTSVAALALVLSAIASVHAGGPCGCEPCCPPPVKPTPPKNYFEVKFKPITIEKPEYRVVCHEVINHVKCVEMVPVWSEKQHTVTTYTKVAREIEKEVVTCRMVPE